MTAMTTAEIASESATQADDPDEAPMITINRRGYSWAVLLAVWSDQHRAWFNERNVSSRRLTSGDVAEFLSAARADLGDGFVEIKPFDHRRDIAVVLQHAQALDWFAGLADEAGAVPKAS